MPELSVDLDMLRRAVLDHVLTEVGDSPLEARLDSPLKLGDVSLAPSAELSVQVFNRPEDRDRDVVFGRNAHISWDLQSAWVKYKLSAKAEAGVPLPAGRGKTAREVELSDYRIHPATDPAWNAISNDLGAPRSLLRLEDVERLAPGEALAMEIGGAISASVAFSWGDAIASRFQDLIRGLSEERPVALKLSAGLEIGASVRVNDRFTVIVSRTPAGRFRIAVTKARSRDHSFGVEVSFGAEGTAIPSIEDALAPVFEGLTGVALEAADRALRRRGAEPREDGDEDLIEKLARSLGIHTRDELEKAVRKAVSRLKGELRKRLEQIARWKVSTAFNYEYARIDENESLADYLLLDDAQLAHDHALAVKGDFERLAEALRLDPSSRMLIRYLNQTTSMRRSSGGFSLGAGRWRVHAKDTGVFRQTTRTSLDGYRWITSHGTRRYEENRVAGNDFEWSVDLKAETPEFLQRPLTRDFDYGLHYSVELERESLAAADLERMLDFAAMWDVRVPAPADLAEAIGRKAAIRVQFLFDREELLAALGVHSNLASWAEPLAAAMPFTMFDQGRSFVLRREAYADAWRAWLLDPRSSSGSLLRKKLRGGLRAIEERQMPASFAWNSGSGHPRLRSRLRAFVRGAWQLREAMIGEKDPQSMATIWASLEQLWTQRLYVAASGRWLLDRASEAAADVNRSMTIEYDDEVVVA